MTFAVPRETIDQAIRMREARMSWGRISRTLGFSVEVLRWRMDENWAERQRERTRKRFPPMAQQNRSSKPWGISQEDIAAVLRTVPTDNRSFTARAFGDPLPGRSALDRRAGETA